MGSRVVMGILVDLFGRKMKEEEHDKSTCDHGVTFDLKEAKKMMAETPHDNSDPVNFIMGSPAHDQIRKRWPRLDGLCPKGCGYRGIAYASMDHLRYGDW